MQFRAASLTVLQQDGSAALNLEQVRAAWSALSLRRYCLHT